MTLEEQIREVVGLLTKIRKLVKLLTKFHETGKVTFFTEALKLDIDYMVRESTGEVFINTKHLLIGDT